MKVPLVIIVDCGDCFNFCGKATPINDGGNIMNGRIGFGFVTAVATGSRELVLNSVASSPLLLLKPKPKPPPPTPPPTKVDIDVVDKGGRGSDNDGDGDDVIFGGGGGVANGVIFVLRKSNVGTSNGGEGDNACSRCSSSRQLW